jgi:tetratricopeptide (TPR) repeat protein
VCTILIVDDDKKIHDFGDEEYRVKDHVFGQHIEFGSKLFGETSAKKGMEEKAIEFYQKALQIDPANANIRKIIKELKKK